MRPVNRRSFVISLSALAGLLAAPESARAQALRQQLAATTGDTDPLRLRKADTAPGLSDSQLATTAALAATIVPADATPSARDLGAHLHVAAGLALVPPADFAAVQGGLDAIADLARQTFGVPIEQLPPEALEAFGAGLSTHPQLTRLWYAIRTLTVLYYYGHPQGYADLGLPGPSLDRGGFPEPDALACLG